MNNMYLTEKTYLIWQDIIRYGLIQYGQKNYLDSNSTQTKRLISGWTNGFADSRYHSVPTVSMPWNCLRRGSTLPSFASSCSLSLHWCCKFASVSFDWSYWNNYIQRLIYLVRFGMARSVWDFIELCYTPSLMLNICIYICASILLIGTSQYFSEVSILLLFIIVLVLVLALKSLSGPVWFIQRIVFLKVIQSSW